MVDNWKIFLKKEMIKKNVSEEQNKNEERIKR